MPFAHRCSRCPAVFDVRDDINDHITAVHPAAASHEFTTRFIPQSEAQQGGPGGRKSTPV